MSGAVIRIDQARPLGGLSTGTVGQARNDIWEDYLVTLNSVAEPNTSHVWTLIDKPPGSTVTLSGANTAICTFTPDIPGSYRVELVTNGGGVGNVSRKIVACRYDNSGVLVQRGWRMPALLEALEESNFGGQVRGFDEAMRFIFDDIRTALASAGGSIDFFDEGVDKGSFAKVDFVGAGVTATDAGGGVLQVDIPVSTAYVDSGDAAALSGAETYADTGDAAEATARANGDAATLTSAEAYTDAKFPVDLGGADVSGTLPRTKQQDQTMGGDCSGTTGACVVGKVNGTTYPAGGALTTGQVPRVTGVATVAYGALDLANANAVTGVLPLANQAVQAQETLIPLLAAQQAWGSSTWLRAGAVKVDLSRYPTSIAGLTRKIRFVVDVQKTSGATTVEAQLYDVDHDAQVSSLTSASTSIAEVSSAVLTEGSSSGNMRTDAATRYEVDLRMNGGVASVDQVSITSAYLRITYE